MKTRREKIKSIMAIAAQMQVITILTTDCKTNAATGEPFTPDEQCKIESGEIVLKLDYSMLSNETLKRIAAGENPFI